MSAEHPPLGSPVIPRMEKGATADFSSEADESPSTGIVREAAHPPLGSPLGASCGFEPVSQENRKKLLERERKEHEEDERIHRGRVFGSVPEIQFPSFLLNTTFVLAIAAIFSVIALFVYAQALTILAEIQSLPTWLQYVSYALLFVFFVLIVGFGVRLAGIYWRLKKTRRINIRGLEELNARSHLRRQVSLETGAARAHLRDYIICYPIGNKQLSEAGFTHQQIAGLRIQREKLTDPQADLGSTAWIVDFKKSFQQILDDAADECIKRHALNVGVRTAAAPFPVADTLIVLYSSLALIGDLCRIYNLRLGRLSTVLVVSWAAGQSLLAGRIEESPTLDSLNDEALHTAFGEQAVKMLATVGSHLTSTATELASRVAKRSMRAIEQGVLQGVLLSRLGKRTKAWLRMVD